MKKIRVLMIDGSPDFLDAVEYFLKRSPAIEITGRTTTFDEGVVLAKRLKPELVLMDLIPHKELAERIQQLKALPSAPSVGILTLYSSGEYRLDAATAGADAFLSKSEIAEKLIPLIYALFPEADLNAELT